MSATATRLKEIYKHTSPSEYPLGYSSQLSLEQQLSSITLAQERLRLAYRTDHTISLDQEFLRKIREGEVSLPEGAERWAIMPYGFVQAGAYSQLLSQAKINCTKCLGFKLNAPDMHQFGSKYLSLVDRTKDIFQQIHAMQPDGDALIVPMQFGMRHRFVGVLDFEHRLTDNECGIGSLHTLNLLLAYPERLKSILDLWIVNSGEKYKLQHHEQECTSFTLEEHNWLVFNRVTKAFDNRSGHYGHPTVFLPNL